MPNYQFTKEQAENYISDGFGQTKSADGSEIIKVWIKVRKDSQIPEFDVFTELFFYTEGFESFLIFHEKLAEMANGMGGMFIEDALKLQDKDVFAMTENSVHPRDVYPIPLLKALKKAIVNYFQKTNQQKRLLKATESVICTCRHVTNHDIEEAVKKGYKIFEEIQKVTGAGTGCNSCVNKTRILVTQYTNIKTTLGGF